MATWVLDRPTATGTVDLTGTTTAAMSNSPAGVTDGSVTAVDLASTAAGVTYTSAANFDDSISTDIRIMSGATVLASGASDAVVALSGSGTPPTSTPITAATNAIGFANVNTGASKALWDAAVVEYTQTIVKAMAGDGIYATWSTVSNNITITYTEAASFVPAWASQSTITMQG